jgi:hypothetical protein
MRVMAQIFGKNASCVTSEADNLKVLLNHIQVAPTRHCLWTKKKFTSAVKCTLQRVQAIGRMAVSHLLRPTLGRMYLITKEQFIDVVKQETDFKGELMIDFDRAISDGSLIFREGSWYGNIIFLGNQYDHPIFSFTHQDNISPTTKPSNKYLRTIFKGIHETYDHLNTAEIVDYLISKQGVANNYSREDLEKLIESENKLQK